MNRSLLVLLFLFAAKSAAAAPGDGFDARHYRVHLTPDYAAQAIAGETVLDFRVTADRVTELTFSPNALDIRDATIDGQKTRIQRRDDALVVISRRPMRHGERGRLIVRYAGIPAQGVTFGTQSVHSNWFACDWMICALDTPGDKATIDLHLHVPVGQTTLGPGRLISRRAGRNGLESHHWRGERPYSSYLFSFAAGRYVETQRRVGHVQLRFLSQTADRQRLERMFEPTATMLRFFEERAGVRFPHRSYAQLHVPGSAAQEAVSFSLIGEQTIAPILDTPQEDWVIAHELAHQWWGNLITCSDWSEFWLNEGITTFMVAAWKEHRWGREAYDREMAMASRRRQRAIEAGLDPPLTYDGPYPSLAHRRAVTYSKGALFLDALRKELGDETFWRGLRLFTVRHAGGVVDSRDFQRAFEEASGRNLWTIFDLWVY